MPDPGAPLRSFGEFQGIRIGAAVDAGPLHRDSIYTQTLGREFNMLTPENAMKFAPLRRSRDAFEFADADAIVEFAQKHTMQVRGHTLVWHRQLPKWLNEGKWSRSELMAILREHIQTVVGRYRGRVVAWDVVNEGIEEDGTFRDTFWLRGLGREYIDLAFRWAHEADPKARLFYNDTHGEELNRKSDAIYSLVRGLKQRGIPIHGVGFQMHIRLDFPPRLQEVVSNMKRLASLGLDVHITEMDVRIKEPVMEMDLVKQARLYGETLRICLTAPNCRAFVMWGFTDRHSWVPRQYPGWGRALIFDDSYQPKPAYHALIKALTD